jgi:hypothetical protein
MGMSWAQERGIEALESHVIWPPPEFSLKTADTDTLRRIGLLRSDEVADDAGASWELLRTRVMDTRAHYIVAAFRLEAPFRRRLESSRNWSGGCLVPHGGQRFRQVASIWQVPNAKLPPDLGGAPPADGDYACSTWVGIDGYRRHANSLPQIGTVVQLEVSGGISTVTQAAWFQWWVNKGGFGPVIIDNLPVAEGNSILGMVNVVSPQEVWFLMLNLDQGAFTVFGMQAPVPAEPVRGTTVQWITERPTRLNSTLLYPLPDYGRVSFEECLARSAADASSSGRWRAPEGVRLIQMTERREGPFRSAVISQAIKTGGRRIVTSYRAVP